MSKIVPSRREVFLPDPVIETVLDACVVEQDSDMFCVPTVRMSLRVQVRDAGSELFSLATVITMDWDLDEVEEGAWVKATDEVLLPGLWVPHCLLAAILIVLKGARAKRQHTSEFEKFNRAAHYIQKGIDDA